MAPDTGDANGRRVLRTRKAQAQASGIGNTACNFPVVAASPRKSRERKSGQLPKAPLEKKQKEFFAPNTHLTPTATVEAEMEVQKPSQKKAPPEKQKQPPAPPHSLTGSQSLSSVEPRWLQILLDNSKQLQEKAQGRQVFSAVYRSLERALSEVHKEEITNTLQGLTHKKVSVLPSVFLPLLKLRLPARLVPWELDMVEILL